MDTESEFQDVVVRAYLECLMEACEGRFPHGFKSKPDPWAIKSRNLSQTVTLFEQFLNIDKRGQSYERSL